MTTKPKPPRIWLSNAAPKAGEVVRVRTQIEHVMESGLRVDTQGKLIPRHIVNRFEARLGPDLLFTWLPETAISQNPYLEFTFMARKSGELAMRWVDDQGAVITATRSITVSA